jgi:hypothetical protein
MYGGVARPDRACLQHMQRGPHARSSCRRWLRLQRSLRSSTPSAAHFLKSHQRLVQKFAADRDRQKKPRLPLATSRRRRVDRDPRCPRRGSSEDCERKNVGMVLHCAINQRHIRRSQPTREAAPESLTFVSGRLAGRRFNFRDLAIATLHFGVESALLMRKPHLGPFT